MFHRTVVRESKGQGLIRTLTVILIGIVLFAAQGLFAQKLQYEYPHIEGFHPLDEAGPVANVFQTESPAVLDLNTSLLTDTAIIDFEKRQITFIRADKFAGIPVWRYHYDELEEYLSARQRFVYTDLWRSHLKPPERKPKTKTGFQRLELVAPIHYPPWARRVLGNEPPKLSIRGYQEIMLGAAWQKRVRDEEVLNDQTPSLEFDHNNAFTIQGSVGRLINVEIKYGNDQGFESNIGEDMLKNLKIEYREDSTGELEDEVIQEVVAGYTNFSMPGAGLAGYSESHEGLFGIKVRSRLGPLELTTIASHEQGETKKEELSLSTAGQNTTIDEKKFKEYKAFFFLDSMYLNKYLGLREDSVPPVTNLKIYRQAINQRVAIGLDSITAYFGYDDSLIEQEARKFVELKENTHYELEPEKGWVWFYDSVDIKEDDVIGIYAEFGDEKVKGSLGTGRGDDTLWVLKARNDKRNSPSYWLLWRNVYEIPSGAKRDDFKISITRTVEGVTYEKNDKGQYFTTILGLADENNKTYVSNSDIFDFDRGYLIIPPFGNDPKGNLPFANPALGTTRDIENANPAIYRVTETDPDEEGNKWSDYDAKFEIGMTGKSRQTNFQIGYGGILYGSETIKMGNIELVRNEDYTIDYESGFLQLISDRARSADNISIDYQSESLFVFDRRVFLGAHGKIDLPNIGRSSYLATSVLYQTTATGDRLPRIGQEPFNRFLVGANTKLDFEPEWMTQAVNLLPRITTDSRSSAVFDAEVAHSRMTPNAGSEALVDNFEASNRSYSLGLSDVGWFRASPPKDFVGTTESDGTAPPPYFFNTPAWETYWYTPEGDHRTSTYNLWAWSENKDAERYKQNTYATTMKLVTQPVPQNEELRSMLVIDADSSKHVRPWAGIMTVLPEGLNDRDDDRYFELIIRNPEDGKLHIDFGQVSEDLILDGMQPNGEHDVESDELVGEDRYQNSLDKGLDGLEDSEEIWFVPNYRKWVESGEVEWVSLGHGDPRLGKFSNDPARDNWRSYDGVEDGEKDNFPYVNGTQGNKYMDYEDLNADGFRTNENVFRASIDLSDVSEYKVEGSTVRGDSGWVHLRIPIKEAGVMDTIGGIKAWTDIDFVRIWWNDFAPSNLSASRELEFAKIEFVGNQWEAETDSGGFTNLSVAILNNEDNLGTYYSPPHMKKERNEANPDLPKREQALSFSWGGVEPGDTTVAERQLWQANDLSAYEQIKMFVKVHDEELIGYGGPSQKTDPRTWFIFRFGSNDSTYYEYMTRLENLRSAWESRDGLVIDLELYSELKLRYLEDYPSPLKYDTAITSENEVHRIFSKTGIAPAFTSIKYMALGVARDPYSENPGGPLSDSGTVWVNELAVTGIQGLTGWAFRGNFQTQWADFMRVGFSLNYQDADFRKMSDQGLTGGASSLGGGMNANWTLNKFLPSTWSVSLPLDMSLNSSLSRPKLRTGSDISLLDEEGRPDRIQHMARDFANMIIRHEDENNDETDAEHYETKNMSRTLTTSYSKGFTSDNPVVHMTAERVNTSVRATYDTTVTFEGPDSTKVNDHYGARSTRSYGGSFSYSLSPHRPPEWTKWRPLADSKAKWFPREWKQYELTFLPNQLNFDLIDGLSYRNLYSVNTRQGITTREKTLGLGHGFQLGYTPISSLLDMDYSLSVKRELNDAVARDGVDFDEFLDSYLVQPDPTWGKYMVLYGEDSRSQNFSLNFSPELVEWLTHTVDYSAGYNQYPQTRSGDSTVYLSGSVNTRFGLQGSFRIRTFLSSMADVTEKIAGVGGFFKGMETAVSKVSLSDFRLSYNASSNLKNDNLSDRYLSVEKDMGKLDLLSYSLGFRDRSVWDIVTGDLDDQNAFGGMHSRTHNSAQLALARNDSRSSSQDWSISTSLRLPSPLDLNLNTLRLGWNRSFSTKPPQKVDTPSEEWYRDTSITWPSAQIGASTTALQKLPFMAAIMKNINLNSDYRFEKTLRLTNTDTTTGFSHGFSPLVGLNGQLKKWPISLTYSHSFSYDSTVNSNVGTTATEGTDGDKKNTTSAVSHTDRAEVKHTIRAGKLTEIKFLRWTIPIKGELAWGISGDRSQEQKEERGVTQVNYTKWSVSPYVYYDFTDNVRGTFEYTGSWENHKRPYEEERADQAFWLKVKINF